MLKKCLASEAFKSILCSFAFFLTTISYYLGGKDSSARKMDKQSVLFRSCFLHKICNNYRVTVAKFFFGWWGRRGECKSTVMMNILASQELPHG